MSAVDDPAGVIRSSHGKRHSGLCAGVGVPSSFIPNTSGVGSEPLVILAVPNALGGDRLVTELQLPVVGRRAPGNLHLQVAALLLADRLVSEDAAGDPEYQDVRLQDAAQQLYARAWHEVRQWCTEEFVTFAYAVAYGDCAIVEESPPRRTSLAAVEASRVAGQVLVAGLGGSGLAQGASVLVTHEGRPMLIVVGAATTLVVAAASSGVVLLTHWAAKKLDV